MDERKHLILLKGQNKTKKADSIANGTALPGYLYPEVNQRKTYPAQSLIFPFGGNASQFQAVENALNHQLSVIQGPPGTKQAKRDRLKDSIFEKYGIPLLRLSTNSSGEIEKVRTNLERAK